MRRQFSAEENRAVKSYTTKPVPRAAKVAYWNGLHSKLFLPVEITPQDAQTFDAEVGTEVLGPVTFTKTTSPPATIVLSQVKVDESSPRRFDLLMPVEGTLLVSHHGLDTEVAAGDLILLDARPPSRLSFVNPNETIIVSMTPATLAAHLPDADGVCGVRVHGDRGMGRVASEMLRSLWYELVRGLPGEMGATIASNLLDVIATSYATEHSVDIHGVTRAKSRKLQVKRFVEAHLREPRLTPGYVADSLNVSTRYIRMLFAEEDEQLSRYILRRRLEKCAEQLRRSAWTRTTITQIAFSWGFRSMPHFARVFRARYEMTPREYRKISAEP